MQNFDLRILFEDEYLAVLVKNTGDDSQTFFKKVFTDKKYKEAVNRLDKPVSGIILIAFSKKIHTALNNAIKLGDVKKEYWAVCKKLENPKIGKKFLCENYLTFNTKIQKGFITTKSANAKKASLYWEIAGIGDSYSFLKIYPITGRTHQIRIQISGLGMPIKGDVKYGSKRTEKNGGIRLHAYSLDFIHPVTKENMFFSSLPLLNDNLWASCINACLKNN